MHIFELPSGTEVELNEMIGAEEELLTNQRLIRNGDAVNQVLRNCTVRLGEIESRPWKTRSIFCPETVCSSWSSCGKYLSGMRRSWNCSVPIQPVVLRTSCPSTWMIWRLRLTAKSESSPLTCPVRNARCDSVIWTTKRKKRLAALKESSISSAMLIRLIGIDGVAPSKKLMNDMSLRDRSALRQEMLRVDAGVDTIVETE